jgi:hypothetical protein
MEVEEVRRLTDHLGERSLLSVWLRGADDGLEPATLTLAK